MKTIIPPVRRDSEIVQKLENLAVRSRLGIKQILPNRPRKKEFYDEYPLAIDVSANYHDLGKFFDRMAHLPRIFNVQGVNIRQSSAAGPNGGPSPYSIEASFTAVTFIYREEAPAAPHTHTSCAECREALAAANGQGLEQSGSLSHVSGTATVAHKQNEGRTLGCVALHEMVCGHDGRHGADEQSGCDRDPPWRRDVEASPEKQKAERQC